MKMALPEISGYSDLEVLGVGGFATVYRALQTAVDRPVAVKVLQAAIRDEDTEHRFARECNVVGSLSWHPHIAAIVDAGNDSTGHPYIVFELLEGGSLGDRLRAGTPLDWVSASGYLCQVADAAEAAHHNGVLHRDIKPDNILLDRLGRAKLADFGIAAMQDGHQTATGHVSATIAHASPEVLSGERADERSDVYLLASTLYELLAGEPPFGHVSGEGLYKAIQRIATETAPRLDARRADVPAGVSNLIAQSLEKDPARRPQSAAAFGVALHRALVDGGERPPVMPWIEQHHRHLLDGARASDPASGARVAETLAPNALEAAALGTPATVSGEVPAAEPAIAATPPVAEPAPPAVPAAAPAVPPIAAVAPAPPGADAPHTVAQSVAPPAVPDAGGDTPKRARRWLLPVGVLTLLAVAAGGVSAWLVLRDGAVDFTVDAQVPSGRSEPGFEARSMVDDDLTTAWMSLEGDSPDGDQLVFGFSHQMELEAITIHSGPGEDPGASLDGTRAMTSALIRLNNDPSCELTSSGDQSGCVSITATPGADTITVPIAQPVTDVVVWVTSTGSGSRGVAVREVEFAGTVGAPVSRSG